MKRWCMLVLFALAGCGLQITAGCSSTPSAPSTTAQGPSAAAEDVRLAQAYASVATARSTAARLLDAGRISVADAERVQAAADGIRASLDLARSALAAGGSRTTYDQTMASAQVLLAGLEATLKEREKR
jgi:hypothetical protein